MTRFTFHIAAINVILAMGSLSHTAAQSNSTTPVATNQLAQYAMVKPLAENRIKEGTQHYIRNVLPYEGPVNLFACGSLELEIGLRRNDLTDVLALVAAYHYWWTRLLSSMGYPHEIVTQLIDEIEGLLIKYVISKNGGNPFLDALRSEANSLSRRLKELKTRQHWRVKDVYYADTCGGPGIFIEFKIPKGVRFFIASGFYVDLCEKQGLPAFDRRKCNHWVEVHDRSQEELAGIYSYLAEMPDGTTKNARINANKMRDGAVFDFYKSLSK